jgi:hypothetical protein
MINKIPITTLNKVHVMLVNMKIGIVDMTLANVIETIRIYIEYLYMEKKFHE